MTLIEMRKPTTAGTYYYKGAPNWSEPSEITVESRRGELFVVFKRGLAPSKLKGCWPSDAKWFREAKLQTQ